MDCREFQRKHVGFVDDLLPAFEMEAMQRHRARCASCARRDAAVRRGLLVVRNLPQIEPSPDFIARLNARLAELGPEARRDVVGRHSMLASFSSVGTFAALAASVAVIAYMSVETTRYFAPVDVPAVQTASVVPLSAGDAASAEPVESVESIDDAEMAPPTVSNAAFVASASTGMPVWPAVLMMGQAPLRFASMQASETIGLP